MARMEATLLTSLTAPGLDPAPVPAGALLAEEPERSVPELAVRIGPIRTELTGGGGREDG